MKIQGGGRMRRGPLLEGEEEESNRKLSDRIAHLISHSDY